MKYEDIEKEFNQLFVKDAGTINASLLNAPSTILSWIQNNFTPKVSRVDAEVKPDFCEWNWSKDFNRYITKCQTQQFYYDYEYKYCPNCGKRIERGVK